MKKGKKLNKKTSNTSVENHILITKLQCMKNMIVTARIKTDINTKRESLHENLFTK